jgi:ATP-dependent RNA helicase DDX49/DBP8
VHKPYFFEDKSEVATVEGLEQKYVLCPVAVKDAYLVYVVKNFHTKRPDSSILIFSHTCRECQALAIMFTGLGFKVTIVKHSRYGVVSFCIAKRYFWSSKMLKM